jgi:hypothetical protein
MVRPGAAFLFPRVTVSGVRQPGKNLRQAGRPEYGRFYLQGRPSHHRAIVPNCQLLRPGVIQYACGSAYNQRAETPRFIPRKLANMVNDTVMRKCMAHSEYFGVAGAA